jgi:single-strand DNA-binding protein
MIMKANGVARIGKDVEVRYSPNGDAIANLSLAFTYGKKQADGKRATQWVDATLFGKRAESLAPYLKKGGQIVAYLSDVNVQTYESKSGQGVKLVGKVDDLELIGGKVEQSTQPVTQSKPVELADIDSDIPF